MTCAKTILDASLCASCGACAAVCSEQAIVISPPTTPVLAPNVMDLDCGSCNLCTEVCPGRDTGVPQSEIRLFGRTRAESERWTGIFRSTYSAYATRAHVSKAASAGGAATTLLVSALERGIIDAALVIGRDEARPWVPVPRLVTTAEDIV